MEEPSNEDRAYIAGFFDGEGSVASRARKIKWKRANFYTTTHSFSATITQVDPRPLIKIKELYGGLLLFRSRIAKENRKDVWLWVLNGQSAVRKFLEDIYPWLIVKQDAASIALEALRMMQGKTGYRYTVQQKNVIVGAFDRLRARNRRGRV